MRVPNSGPAVREREAMMRYFQSRLAYFQKIPARRREAECADEGERDCAALLRQLEIDGNR
jgi:hypothetical protein|tara:strand:+ start:1450 stop:1632 length:183 start_codon:yes stop_codon:yes gene_type:complete